MRRVEGVFCFIFNLQTDQIVSSTIFDMHTLLILRIKFELVNSKSTHLIKQVGLFNFNLLILF
jgi:hypothetical protein